MIQIYGYTPNFGNYNNGYTTNRAFFGYVVNYTSSAIFNPLENQTTIGNVAAIAYSYDPVSSNTNMTAVIGAPITELDTAAIPETARTESNSGLIDVTGN